MKTENYTLRDGAISFDIEVPEASLIRTLSDEQLVALVQSGLSNWAYRAGAKQANNEKTFSLSDVAADLLTVKTKGGEPSKQDKELATDFMKEVKKRVDVLEPREGMTKATSQELECRERFCDFITKAEAKWGFKYTGPCDWSHDSVSEFRRTFRLAKARFIRNADDI